MWVNFTVICLLAMCERSMRGIMELVKEIQLIDWSTAGKQAITGAIYFLFHNEKKSSFDRPNYTSIIQFTLRFLSGKKCRKEICFDKLKIFL